MGKLLYSTVSPIQYFRVWFSRLFLLALFSFAASHIQDNFWGMIGIMICSLLIAGFIPFSKILVYNDRLELKKKYLFNLFIRMKSIEIKNVIYINSGDATFYEGSIELLAHYSLNNLLTIKTRDGKQINFKSTILRSELRELVLFVRTLL